MLTESSRILDYFEFKFAFLVFIILEQQGDKHFKNMHFMNLTFRMLVNIHLQKFVKHSEPIRSKLFVSQSNAKRNLNVPSVASVIFLFGLHRYLIDLESCSPVVKGIG